MTIVTNEIPGIELLSPKQLEGYLDSLGWRMTGELESLARIWRGTGVDGSQAEIMVPADESIADYESRMADAIEVLSIATKSSERRLTERIAALTLDAIRVSVIHEDVKGGTLNADDGVTLFSGLRDLMVAAARSTIAPKRHHQGGESKETKSYHEALRFGQTEVGSYVVTIYAPLEDSQVGPQTQIETESFSRLVLHTLVDSLGALQNATISYNDSDGFDDFFAAVEVGVSANMCDALASMGGKKHARAVEIDVQPSPMRRLKETAFIDYSFATDALGVIAQAADKLREEEVLPNFEVIGVVDKLKRNPRDAFGVATIQAPIFGELKHVNVELGEEDYEKAVDAHRLKSTVSCRGALHIAPRVSQLLKPREFKVIDRQLFDGD